MAWCLKLEKCGQVNCSYSMETTKLIQRLIAPRGINPFAFGSGGGRLSEDAMKLIAPIVSFDYMGGAEYEFGAIPDALRRLSVESNLFYSTIEIRPKDVKKTYYHRSDDKRRSWESCPVYIVGPKVDRTEIERRVLLLATDEDHCYRDGDEPRLEGMYVRDSVQLGRWIKFEPTFENHAVGWLELNNGFFFSVDKVMADRFAALFNAQAS